jgi:hypothetical protein
MVVAGMPFRDAKPLQNNWKTELYSPKETKHTHEGSNNLCLDEIIEK